MADVAANTRSSGNLTNQATLAWTDPATGAQTRTSPIVTTQIVEPLISQTKTDSTNHGAVLPNDIVTYTVTTSNSGTTRVSTAHDLVITDHVPVGVTPVGAAPANRR